MIISDERLKRLCKAAQVNYDKLKLFLNIIERPRMGMYTLDMEQAELLLSVFTPKEATQIIANKQVIAKLALGGTTEWRS